MKKSKIVFLIICIIFFIIMGILSYDISSKTTFPGSKPQLKERLMQKDTLAIDNTNGEKIEIKGIGN